MTDRQQLAEFVRLVEQGEPVPDNLLETAAEFVRQKMPKRRGRPRGSMKLSDDDQLLRAVQFAVIVDHCEATRADALATVACSGDVDVETMRGYLKRLESVPGQLEAGNFPDEWWGVLNAAVLEISQGGHRRKKIAPI